jgi:hypothetical protein
VMTYIIIAICAFYSPDPVINGGGAEGGGEGGGH